MLVVHSAYDQSELARYPYDDAAAVDAMLATAAKLAAKPLPAAERIAILEKAIELGRPRVDALALDIAREGGKPLVDARVEIERGLEGIANAIETLRTESGREIPMNLGARSTGRLAFTTREPIGVVVAVSAFNHPFNLIVHQVIPAVAVGCPVIVKPAGTTPISCFNLVNLLREAGLPEEWCQVAILQTENATKLVTDPRVAFFSFIGSSRVGWMLRSKLAPGARCALEHGGVAPVIVAADAELDAAIPSLVKGGYYHAGQVCVSVQRVYVHEGIFDDFKARFTEAVAKLKVGDPTSAETEVGPLITPKEVERVDQWVREAIDAGAECTTGGQVISATTYAPTVLVNPPEQASVSRNEVFGPVVCLYTYSDIQDAIARANALDVAFQSAVFTANIDTALSAAKGLAASAVMVNDHTAFRVDWMPFAGQRTSGHGTGGIPYTMHEMTQEKLIVFKSPALEP
ncbi:MAG: aldehyde dehydrogenase family protein [Opitutales bacterium]